MPAEQLLIQAGQDELFDYGKLKQSMHIYPARPNCYSMLCPSPPTVQKYTASHSVYLYAEFREHIELLY